MGVVGGELWKDSRLRGRKEPGRANLVTQVGVHLAREDGVVGESPFLGELDFRIPIGALDQAHHQPPVRVPGQRDQPVGHLGRPLLVGLQHEPQPVPARKRGVPGERLEQIERGFESSRFLRVDAEAEAMALGPQREFLERDGEFGLEPVPLRVLEARMKRRQLDRNAVCINRIDCACCLDHWIDCAIHAADRIGRPFHASGRTIRACRLVVRIVPACRLVVQTVRTCHVANRSGGTVRPADRAGLVSRRADRIDRARIGFGIAPGVPISPRAFAEHVERIPDIGSRRRPAPPHRLGHVAPEHELPAQYAHRLQHGLAHHRFAHAGHQAAHPGAGVGQRVAVERHQPAGEHQAPDRGVDEPRVRLAAVGAPVPRTDFLGDQPVGCGLVRDSQQRLREAHQRDALAVRQAEFLQKDIERSRAVGGPAAAFHHAPGVLENGLALVVSQDSMRFIRERQNRRRFVGAVGRPNRVAQRVEIRHGDSRVRAHLSCSLPAIHVQGPRSLIDWRRVDRYWAYCS